MKKQKTILDAFTCHGLTLDTINESQAKGECPFCNKPNHFFVRYAGVEEKSGGRKSAPGMWSCKLCNPSGGNIYTFLLKVIETSRTLTTKADYSDLWKLKRIPASIAKECWICKSFITGEWLVPTCKRKDERQYVTNIHRYYEGKNKLLGTDTLPVELLGLEWLSTDLKPLHITEGHWDRPVYEYIWRKANRRDEIDILSVPGAGTFKQEWLSFLENRPQIVLLFDNDHVKYNSQTGMPRQAGLDGIKRIAKMIAQMPSDVRPPVVEYLRWPEGLDDGFDIRDLFTEYLKPLDRRTECFKTKQQTATDE